MCKYTFFLIIAVASCYPQKPKDEIIQQEFKPLHGDRIQTYSYSFRTSNGIFRKENGAIDTDATNGMVVRGTYSYTRPDGRLERIGYIADLDGFRIIKQSPIVPEVAASLAG